MELDKALVAQRIKELIKEKGLTQAGLAEKTSITQAAISQIVNGERFPTMPVLMQIARALTVSLDYLVGKSEDREKTNDVAAAITNDAGMLQFFRNFQSLDPNMQDLLRRQADIMKNPKK